MNLARPTPQFQSNDTELRSQDTHARLPPSELRAERWEVIQATAIANVYYAAIENQHGPQEF